MKFRLLHDGNERRLSPGSFLIGRSPDCAVVIEDPLVSRHHAALLVTEESVRVEDLGSRNGVYVNGTRIAAPTFLHDGDTLEIVEHALQLAVGSGLSGFSTTARAPAAPEPAAMLSVLGALADKALAMGNGAEAQRILATQLDILLNELNEGRAARQPVVELALRYAARLAVGTRRGYWYSYVFRMLRAAGVTCPADVLDELYSGASRAEATDLKEIRDYIDFHATQTPSMTPRERFILSRVQGLERLLSA